MTFSIGMTRKRRRPVFFGPYLTASERSLWMRLPVLLLLAVQTIAPFWHVCEMSGRCGDCKPQANGVVSCHAPVAAQSSAATQAEARPRCGHCKTPVYAGADSRPGKFKGTCLARELMAMGRVAVAPLVLSLAVRRVRVAPPAFVRLPDVAALPFVPSRGPPVFL